MSCIFMGSPLFSSSVSSAMDVPSLQGEAPFLSWSFLTNWLQKQLDVDATVKDRTDLFLELRAEYLSYFAPPWPRRQRLLQPMCTLGLVYTQFPPLLSFPESCFNTQN